jgi:hypothetical protein
MKLTPPEAPAAPAAPTSPVAQAYAPQDAGCNAKHHELIGGYWGVDRIDG